MTTDKKIDEICRESEISYLGLFGSHARGQEKADSDIDLLVRFINPVGYFRLIETENKLKDYFDKDVDLVTENALSEYIKPSVNKYLQTLYGER